MEMLKVNYITREQIIQIIKRACNRGDRPNLKHDGFNKLDLSDVNFCKADLNRTEFIETNLQNANLSGTILDRANFTNANLRDANLSGSKMYKTNLCGADMTGANLVGIDLNWIKVDKKTKWPQLQPVDFQQGKYQTIVKPPFTHFDIEAIIMNTPETLQPIIVAFDDKDAIKGHKLLVQFLHKEPRNEYAWLLLATILDDFSKQHQCIQRALSINPTCGIGKKLMLALDKESI